MKALSLKAGKNRSTLHIANDELAEILTSYRATLTQAVESGSGAVKRNTEHGYGRHFYKPDELAERVNLVDEMIKEL